MLMRARWLRWIPLAATVLVLAPIHLPGMLLFRYEMQAHGITVHSEAPLPPALIEPILAEAQARIDTSRIAARPQPHTIYLTMGGWRWDWLALGSRETFAVTRMFTENTIVNRSDLATNTVWSRRRIGSHRRLSSDIAHETCHSMIRDHFGIVATLRAPTWVIEGYCDFVAGESTLSAADVARLEASGIHHPTIDNYHAREKVAAILAANGNSVDRLFAEAR
jgi:hypothetical protein